ncbi:MAG: insulinase family protein [Nitrospirae bacterium]|nr:insulinase family protein [Nitrospirota bacterium]
MIGEFRMQRCYMTYKLLRTRFVLLLGLVISLLALTSQEILASPKAEPKRVVLDNGIILLITETHALPMVNISVAVKTGAIYDPPGKGGVASLTAILLDEGTKTRTSRQIAEEIDFIGGSLSTSGGMDYSSASLVVLKKDIATGLALLSDILINPVFPEEEVERKKKETLAAILAEKDDPGSVASKAFYKAVFGSHPYGAPPEGNEETIPKISREDLVSFYQKYYTPNNTIIAVVGDVDLKEAVALIEGHFKSWEKKEGQFPDISPVKRLTKRDSILIDKNITQANILLGHTGISRDNPDFYAVYVMNYILGGGGFSSRLTKEIRDNKGLAYGVYSRFDLSKQPGAFAVSIQTKNETARVAIDNILTEIKRIREEQVADEELREAKDYLTGSFPLKLDTNAKIANYVVFMEFYNLGLDYFDQYLKHIASVTKEDILRVAKKYIDTENFVTVAVAQQEKAGLKE